MSLAQDLADAVAADGAHRQQLLTTALRVGQWLADRGRPGDWTSLDVAALTAEMALPDQNARDGYLLTLAGLLGFAGFAGSLPEARVRDYMTEIEALTKDPTVRAFVRCQAGIEAPPSYAEGSGGRRGAVPEGIRDLRASVRAKSSPASRAAR